eukprot:2692192-Rhodomonas_salina.1
MVVPYPVSGSKLVVVLRKSVAISSSDASIPYTISGSDVAAASAKLRCYAVPGTDKGQLLSLCYAMSGTNMVYAATTRRSAARCQVPSPALILRIRYALPGTDILCPVLAYRGRYWHIVPSTDTPGCAASRSG